MIGLRFMCIMLFGLGGYVCLLVWFAAVLLVFDLFGCGLAAFRFVFILLRFCYYSVLLCCLISL